MATFGIEGMRYFGNLRATGMVSETEDLTYVFNICNGLDDKLRDDGNTRSFYWANDDCWEIDLHSSGSGGIDDDVVEGVGGHGSIIRGMKTTSRRWSLVSGL